MASTLEKVTLPLTKEKNSQDYLRYSQEMLNVSMRDVLLRTMLSTAAFYTIFWLLRAGPLSATGSVTFITTLFLERGLLQYVSTFAFFAGFWFLVLKIPKIDRESNAFNLLDFPQMKVFPIGSDEAVSIAQRVRSFDNEQRSLVIIRRVETAIQRLIHTKSTSEVHDVLNTMCEIDRGIAEASYRTVRFSVWLLPVMGFLGTVMGISKAISEFAVVVKGAGALNLDALKPALANATYNLGVAFDTTLLALALSAVLVFFMFYVQRKEEIFLSAVDEFCISEIVNKLFVASPDTAQIISGLDQVTNSIDTSIGDLKTELRAGLNKMTKSLKQKDEPAIAKLLDSIGARFTQLMETQNENEKVLRDRFSELTTGLSNLVDKGKAMEGFVVGLGNVANLEEILKSNRDTLKTLEKSFTQQQSQVGQTLDQNKKAFAQLLAPLEELAKGIKIKVGD